MKDLNPIRVMIVDSSPAVRQGFVILLETVSDIELVAECAYGAQAVQIGSFRRPDIVLLDSVLPDMMSDEVITQLKRVHPHVQFILLTRGEETMPRADSTRFPSTVKLETGTSGESVINLIRGMRGKSGKDKSGV